MKKLHRKVLCLFLSMIICILSACGQSASVEQNTHQDGNTTEDHEQNSTGSSVVQSEFQLADEYDMVYQNVSSVIDRSNAAADLTTYQYATTTESEPSVYFSTATTGLENGQRVPEVEEGQIIQTDGTYIYALDTTNYLLRIFKTEASTSTIVNEIQVGIPWEDGYENDMQNYVSEEQYPYELYLYEDRLAILCNCYSDSCYADPETGEWKYDYQNYVMVDIYDVSTPAEPQLLCRLGQDGYAGGSQLQGGILYLTTNYTITAADEARPETYIPRLYEGEEASLAEAGNIAILTDAESASYSVVGAYDLTDCVRLSNQNVFGNGGGTFTYLDGTNLYLASVEQVEKGSAPYTDGIYSVVDYVQGDWTRITKLSAQDGTLQTKAACIVQGSADGRFALDSEDGYLRIITSTNQETYSLYTDEEKGFVNSVQTGVSKSQIGLYILDEQLILCGEISQVAPEQGIYLGAFCGEYAYFNATDETIPLLCADLSDPMAPQMVDLEASVELPNCLVPWGENQLLGLRYTEYSDLQVFGGIEILVYDLSNSPQIEIVSQQPLATEESSALYDVKALLLMKNERILGVPEEDGYTLYRYSDETGFTEELSVQDEDGGWSARGLHIGDFLYIFTPSKLTVVQLETMQIQGTIVF
jgi:uncharacterized secreted protein with C-terminal beta-propeller domain